MDVLWILFGVVLGGLLIGRPARSYYFEKGIRQGAWFGYHRGYQDGMMGLPIARDKREFTLE